MDFHADYPPFVPHRLVRGGNAQTVAGAFWKPPPEPTGTRQFFVTTTLGDQIALHANCPSRPQANGNPVRQVLMLHGLAGCHGSTYMLRACWRLLEAGYHVWRMDARGAGAGARHARYHHHAGRAEDFQAAVECVVQQYPHAPLTVVGFSLGGNIVLNWLGSDSFQLPSNLDSAISVAPPIDLFRCSDNLKSGLSRGYDRYFASLMLQRRSQRRRARPDMIDFPMPRVPETLKQFDSCFTAPAGGFQSIDDYYQASSSCSTLVNISTPTLILVDELDPVIPVDMFHNVPVSDAIRIQKTRGGGHLGYIGKNGVDPDCHWLGWRIVDMIVAFECSRNLASNCL